MILGEEKENENTSKLSDIQNKKHFDTFPSLLVVIEFVKSSFIIVDKPSLVLQGLKWFYPYESRRNWIIEKNRSVNKKWMEKKRYLFQKWWEK